MSAPERIWVQWPQANGTGLAFSCQSRPPALRTEYLRADLCPTPPAIDPKVTAIVEAAKNQLTALEAYMKGMGGEDGDTLAYTSLQADQKLRAALAAWEAQ